MEHSAEFTPLNLIENIDSAAARRKRNIVIENRFSDALGNFDCGSCRALFNNLKSAFFSKLPRVLFNLFVFHFPRRIALAALFLVEFKSYRLIEKLNLTERFIND